MKYPEEVRADYWEYLLRKVSQVNSGDGSGDEKSYPRDFCAFGSQVSEIIHS